MMTATTYWCRNAEGKPKERFASEHAARVAVARKRRFKGRRFPKLYRCPGCRGVHLTSGER